MGFLLGYGMKKLTTFFLKIVALTSSLFMLGIAWLASIGVVTLNLDAFTSTLEIGLGDAIANLVTLFAFLAQILPITGSFALGFYAGARKG